jgi:hypothetical protein
VAEHRELVEAIADDPWWVDVTPPMPETARLRLRGLARLVEPSKRDPVYADFTDELVAPIEVTLPGTAPGINLLRHNHCYISLYPGTRHQAAEKIGTSLFATPSGRLHRARLPLHCRRVAGSAAQCRLVSET